MKSPRIMSLDFDAAPRAVTVGGATLCLLGLAAAVAVGMDFQRAVAERSSLSAALELADQQHRPASADSPARAAEQAEIAKVGRELAVPWTRLLAELEAASSDMQSKVSMLQVEPDADKHVVRITAEVRSLPDGLAYLQRLQKSPLLRYPMLESHERRKDDPEHAVRIKVLAEWRS